MNSGHFKIGIFCAVMMLVINSLVFSQSETPVRLEFDEDAKKTDLLSGREVPEYQYAQRGSFQFFRDRMDTPDDFLHYSHDGIRKSYIKNMKYMIKIQKQFGVWTIMPKTSWKEPSPVHSRAVSFIPLSLSTKEPEERVYILLDDLKLIDWENNQ